MGGIVGGRMFVLSSYYLGFVIELFVGAVVVRVRFRCAVYPEFQQRETVEQVVRVSILGQVDV